MENRESKTLQEIYKEKYYENGKLSDNPIQLGEQKGYLECLQQFHCDRWIEEELHRVITHGIFVMLLNMMEG